MIRRSTVLQNVSSVPTPINTGATCFTRCYYMIRPVPPIWRVLLPYSALHGAILTWSWQLCYADCLNDVCRICWSTLLISISSESLPLAVQALIEQQNLRRVLWGHSLTRVHESPWVLRGYYSSIDNRIKECAESGLRLVIFWCGSGLVLFPTRSAGEAQPRTSII